MSRRIDWYESGMGEDDPGDDAQSVDARRRRAARLEVLREGPGFTIFSKPAGVATVPERFDRDAPTVVAMAAELWSRTHPGRGAPVVCHRLDKDTSGCLALAHDRATARILMTAFRKRRVEKTYLALTLGAPQPPEGEVEVRVTPDPKRPGAMMSVKRGGKPCSATYATVEAFRGLSLVRVTPTTGRTHEVRLALASLGTPCAIDPLYGTQEPLMLSHWKRDYRAGRGREERPLIERLTLHAERLVLPDPTAPDDEALRIAVEAPLPRDLAATLRQLRRWAAPGTL